MHVRLRLGGGVGGGVGGRRVTGGPFAPANRNGFGRRFAECTADVARGPVGLGV